MAFKKEFDNEINEVYKQCAICGFQFDRMLDAVFIVPISQGGTFTYDNILGLCPNCHRMFDMGLILVDGKGKIHLNSRHAQEAQQKGLADSYQLLKSRLHTYLLLPHVVEYHPSSENLKRTLEARR